MYTTIGGSLNGKTHISGDFGKYTKKIMLDPTHAYQ